MKQKEMRKAINDSIREAFGVDFIELTKRLPDETLFELGKLVGSTDYVVQFFGNKNHPKFYHNREALEKTIRKEWSTSFIDRAERMANHLLKNEFEITRVLQIEKKGESEKN